MSFVINFIPTCCHVGGAWGALVGARIGAGWRFRCGDNGPCRSTHVGSDIGTVHLTGGFTYYICKKHREEGIFLERTGPRYLRATAIVIGTALGALVGTISAFVLSTQFPVFASIVANKIGKGAIPTILFWAAIALIPKGVTSGLKVCMPYPSIGPNMKPSWQRTLLEFWGRLSPVRGQ